MEERYERRARNEALLREVNERVAALDRGAQAGWANGLEERFDFQCECGRSPRCEQHVALTLTEYDVVREQVDRFVVVPGHEEPAVERVVRRGEGYFVVDKLADVEPQVGGDGLPHSGR
jgi:hypothetical protein